MLFVDSFSVFWLLVSCFYFAGCSVFLYCSYIVPVSEVKGRDKRKKILSEKYFSDSIFFKLTIDN